MIVFAGRTATEQSTRRERLAEQPPSAKLAFKVLELDAELTQSEIAERSRLSKRTTRHALATLAEADLVDSRTSLLDARKQVYSARPLEVEAPPAD